MGSRVPHRRFGGLWLIGLVLALFVGATVWAADPPTTGPSTAPATAPAADAEPTKPSKDRAWVSGTVLDEDGKPVVGLTVRAEKNEPMAMGPTRTPQDLAPKEYLAVTDENGNFVFKEMMIANYLLIAGSGEVGWIYQPIPLEPGKETKLGEIKLTKV